MLTINLYDLFIYLVAEKDNLVSPDQPKKKEESNKREMNRDGEKEEKSKKLRKTESKENIPISVDKKPVIIFRFYLLKK